MGLLKTYENTPEAEKELFRDFITSNMYGVEIGVLNGETSSFLLSLGTILYGIDPLIPDSMESSLIGSLDSIKQNTGELFDKRFTFIKDYSYNVYNTFGNQNFEFIFIDGDHTYEAVKQDYNLYFPKIKTGGLIFFHDSRMNRGGAPFHEGSSKFVDEIILHDKRIELIAEAFSLTCFKKL